MMREMKGEKEKVSLNVNMEKTIFITNLVLNSVIKISGEVAK